MRIRFNSEQEQIRGNWILIKNTVSRRLRGDIFEIADEDVKLLDDHQLDYSIVPFDPNEPNEGIQIPITFEIPRRRGIRAT